MISSNFKQSSAAQGAKKFQTNKTAKPVAKAVPKAVPKAVSKAVSKAAPAKKFMPSKTGQATSKVTLSTKQKQCLSIRSSDEPHLRCLMKINDDQKYCAIHLSQKNIVDFVQTDDDMLDMDERIMLIPVAVTNPIIKTISLIQGIQPKTQFMPKQMDKKSDGILREQKASTMESLHKENEDDLEIKLLILVNDDEYCEKISELIGPVFNDITLSEDDQDPVTLDPIWTLINGVKTPAAVNKYYLFSYKDAKDKIRCMTVFTLYNMVQNNDYVHPMTMEAIPEADIERAKELVELYTTKIGLFNDNDSDQSPEFKLKNRLTKLFKQFHVHSIYFEESWLVGITDQTKLYKIISETEKLVSNNIKSINPDLHGFKVFQKKQTKSFKSKSKSNSNNDDDSIINLQEYIAEEWEKLVKAANNSQNQIPIWIIASGLSFVVPEIKQKFPNLELMMQ